jgi:hypothetical protein
MTLLLPASLVERFKNAVYWTPAGITISDVATTVLEKAIMRLEKQYNGGEHFKRRRTELKGGRPIR